MVSLSAAYGSSRMRGSMAILQRCGTSMGGAPPPEPVLSLHWRPHYGRRVFQFDVFLSHNNADGSDALCRALQAAGAKAWHDGDADMEDRNVRQRVEEALNASRYVLVCVPATFRDSQWCRAEWAPALRQAAEHSFERVLVAAEDGAPVPADLAPCRRFRWDDVTVMATHVTRGNLLPFDPAAILNRTAPARAVLPGPDSDHATRLDAMLASGRCGERQRLILEFCRRIVTEGETSLEEFRSKDEASILAAVPGMARDLMDDAPEHWGAAIPILRAVSWAAIASHNYNNQANGVGTLLALAHAPRPAADAVADVMTLLGSDVDDASLTLAVPWLALVDGARGIDERMVQLTAIRLPQLFRGEQLDGLVPDPETHDREAIVSTLRKIVDRQPECVRARVLAETHIAAELSPQEHAVLFHQRLRLLRDQQARYLAGDAAMPKSEAPTMIEVESLLSEFRRRVFVQRSPELIPAILEFYETAVAATETLNGWPYTEVDVRGLDLLIEPLWRLDDELRDQLWPMQLLQRALAVLSRPHVSGLFAACYRALQNDIGQGVSRREAEHKFLRCWDVVDRKR
jgi:hypothetical protein